MSHISRVHCFLPLWLQAVHCVCNGKKNKVSAFLDTKYNFCQPWKFYVENIHICNKLFLEQASARTISKQL